MYESHGYNKSLSLLLQFEVQHISSSAPAAAEELKLFTSTTLKLLSALYY